MYYGFRFIARFVLPLILGAAVKKAQKKYGEQVSGQDTKQRPVGEVTIEKIPKKETKSKKDKEGEYVDFEEVED